MRFIEESKLAELQRGSAESLASTMGRWASSEIGEAVTVVATHVDHVIGVVGERLIRVSWNDGSPKIEDVDVEFVTEDNLDCYVSRSLRSEVLAMLGEGEYSCNRLPSLARNLVAEAHYWASDGFSGAEALLDNRPGWLEDCDRAIDDGKCSEVVDSVVGLIPKTPYSRISLEHIGDFRGELYESIGVLVGLLDGLIEKLSGFDFSEGCFVFESSVVELLPELLSESERLSKSVGVVLRFSRDSDLPRLAELHDNFAVRLKSVLVLSELIGQLGSTGDKDDVSESTT